MYMTGLTVVRKTFGNVYAMNKLKKSDTVVKGHVPNTLLNVYDRTL